MGKSLLLVDDADALRELLGDAIERRGLKVLRAATGVQAIKLFKEHLPEFVFLDIKLPDLNGVNVFEQLRQIDINLNSKIYFITGKDNEHFRSKAMELGASGYLVKPVKLEDLLAILGLI
jgi:DNA-binding response OmpR family regulator